MPRGARLDAPGVLHHVMARGIERRVLFSDQQDYQNFLGRIGRAREKAQRFYLAFVRDGVPMVQATDQLGGGLVAENLKINHRPRRGGERDLYDGRVLGEGEFVQEIWKQVDKREGVLQRLKRAGWDLRRLAQEVSRQEGISERALFSRSRQRKLTRAKAIFLYASFEYLGASLAPLASRLQMSTGAASRVRERGSLLIAKSPLERKINKLISKNRP